MEFAVVRIPAQLKIKLLFYLLHAGFEAVCIVVLFNLDIFLITTLNSSEFEDEDTDDEVTKPEKKEKNKTQAKLPNAETPASQKKKEGGKTPKQDGKTPKQDGKAATPKQEGKTPAAETVS